MKKSDGNAKPDDSPVAAPIPKAAGVFTKEKNMFALGWIMGTVTTIGLYLLIKHYEQNWVYNKWYRQQHKICEELDIEPSNCVILGVDTKQLYPEYNRGGKTNRLCFSKLWDGRQGDTI